MGTVINYYGTENFQERPYTGRLALWRTYDKQEVPDEIATILLAANAGFVEETDLLGEQVSFTVDPLTGRITSVSPAGIPFVLLQCGVPIGIAPTGTMAANGAVTLGTALNTTYSGGLWLYFPSGAVYSGSAAGFYWTVMSSTTLGTVYDNIYVPGTNSFDIPASPTAIVAAGPGAYTGVTSEITALSVTVPGGLMGKNGGVYEEHAATYNNSANNKTVSSKLAGTMFGTFLGTTSTFFRYISRICNQGSESKNFYNPYQHYGVTNSSSWTTINTAVNQVMTMTLTRPTATDTLVLEYCRVEVIPS